jgi:hypothetical protein
MIFEGFGAPFLRPLEREHIEREHRIAREVAVRVLCKGHELGEQRYIGPEAHFYRMIHRNQRRNPINPENPLHPDETSVSVASDPQAVAK